MESNTISIGIQKFSCPVTAATISASLRLSPGERTLYLDIFGYGRLDGVQYNVPAHIKHWSLASSTRR